MKDIGVGRFEAFSAGVTPKGQVSPITLEVLQDKFRIDASGARSKSWEDFKDEHLDFIVSVSEQAEETSHAFPDQPILAHWPYEDPTKFQGTPEQVEAAYFRVASRIRYRLQLFNNLSFDRLTVPHESILKPGNHLFSFRFCMAGPNIVIRQRDIKWVLSRLKRSRPERSAALKTSWKRRSSSGGGTSLPKWS